jgi:hypothetical protein
MAGPEAEGLTTHKQAKIQDPNDSQIVYLNTLNVLERFSETKQQQSMTPTHIT